MFHQLVSHNPDLEDLVKRGYAVGFDTGYLIIRDVPYLNSKQEVEVGAFVTKMNFRDEHAVELEDHQIFFAGGVPHALNGAPIPQLGGGGATLTLDAKNNDVVVQRSFSNKPQPAGGFSNFFEKIEHYVTLIAGPAMELHGADPLTYRISESFPDSVFKFQDTLTSRAEIGDLSAKLKEEVVAVIGLGGTGSYLLDFMMKTPVKEIRGFDSDVYHVHTAFRSPGKLEPAELSQTKADVYKGRYDSFRHGLKLEKLFINADSAGVLDGVTFAFVCVDKGSSRSEVFRCLIERKIPFIDIGLGLCRREEKLSGMLRVTYYPPERADELRERGLAELKDFDDDVYRTNVQTAELNALNAALAVIRYKQIRGFYFEDRSPLHILFDVDELKLTPEWDL